jgi:hypothetical protein
MRSTVLGHPVIMLSIVDLAVNDDSLPLHVLGIEPMEQQIAVGQFLIEKAERLDAYGSQFATLHSAAWREVIAMAQSKRGGLEFDLQPIVEAMGMRKVIEKLGEKQLVEEIGIDRILANLTPAQRRELRRRFDAESKCDGD